MLQKLCRLCLDSDSLIYMFDNRLKMEQTLRYCILLSAGVHILETDQVSKFVCHNCCTIAVKLFKYRKNAIANDKALKEHIGQQYTEPISNKEDIVKFHNSLLNCISKSNLNGSVGDSSDLSDSAITDSPNNGNILSTRVKQTNLAVHTSVRQLFKRNPKIVIPNELIQYDIDPKIALNENEVTEWEKQSKLRSAEREIVNPEVQAIDLFKQKCPAININIVRIPATARETTDLEKPPSIQPQVIQNGLERSQSDERNVQITESHFADLRESTNSVLRENKRRRSNSESPEVIPPKKKRIFSKESKSLHKIELPEKSPNDPESKKVIFTSSLELTSSENNITKVQQASSVNESLENSFLTPLSKEEILICSCCGKMCNSKNQLKNHERVHKTCIVCRTKHTSAATLLVHLREVCYKKVKTNQPYLCLIRIDEIPRVVGKYKDAFDYYFYKINEGKRIKQEVNSVTQVDEEVEVDILALSDDDDVIIVDEYDNSSRLEPTEDFPNEKEYIFTTFKKYNKSSENNENKLCQQTQTVAPETNVKYTGQSNVIIENMYSDLLIYKVPLEMSVSQKVSARLTYTPRAKLIHTISTWNSSLAIDLTKAVRSTQSTLLVSNNSTTRIAEAPTPPYNFLLTGALSEPNLIITNSDTTENTPKNVSQQIILRLPIPSTAAQTNTAVTSNYPLLNTHLNSTFATPSLGDELFSHINPSSLLKSNGNAAKAKYPATTAVNNVLLLQNVPALKSLPTITQNGAVLKSLPILTHTSTPSSKTSKIVNSSNGTSSSVARSTAAQKRSTVSATSNIVKTTQNSSTESSCFLRVKAPWELNNQL